MVEAKCGLPGEAVALISLHCDLSLDLIGDFGGFDGLFGPGFDAGLRGLFSALGGFFGRFGRFE